jgi:FdhD protein
LVCGAGGLTLMAMHISESLSTQRPVILWRSGSVVEKLDSVALEEPLEIRLAAGASEATAIAVTMRTPGHDEDLAAGFCLTEGIIERREQIERIEAKVVQGYGDVVTVTLGPLAGARSTLGGRIEEARRQVYMSSSCGLCGKESIDRIAQKFRPVRGDFSVSHEALRGLPVKMRAAQPTFDTTGGLHAAAIFSPDGELIVLREDIGRHNAVDKVIGHVLRHARVPVDPALLLISGRGGFEIIQKAAMAGIPVIAAVGAPSSLAVDLAARANQTLVGFLREDRMNIYTHPGRVQT